MWTYNNAIFLPTPEELANWVGYVYLITEKDTDMKYIGKKLFWSKRRLPPLKGKTRKRTVISESDWKTYYGSSEELKLLVETNGGDNYTREILHFCKGKGEMSYLEIFEQITRHVLLREDYHNGFIGGKIHRNHVKGIVLPK
jgi:hypothetical protein